MSDPPDRLSRAETRIAPYAFVVAVLHRVRIFGLFPLVYTAWVSLHDWSLLGGNQGFVGLDNYRELMRRRRLLARA